MLNVLIAGVGGQGSVLAARILAQAAETKGWQVRSAETIGMAQRGGSVTSHVRMGNRGEEVHSSLVPRASADLIIALEPAEAARALPFLVSDGLLVCARSAVRPVADTPGVGPYRPEEVIAYLETMASHTVMVDDARLCDDVGSRKALNIVMLATAVQVSLDSVSSGAAFGLADAIDIDELKDAVTMCVKERFVALNCSAIDHAVAAISESA